MPVMPDCHGTRYSSPLSIGRPCQAGSWFAVTLGSADLSSFSAYPSRIHLPAIQSVSTTMSRLMSWPASSWALTWPKNDSLSSMSSRYLEVVVKALSNWSSEGCLVLPSVSMYSGQLENVQLGAMSAGVVPALGAAAAVPPADDPELEPPLPHAARRAEP